jgi:hypothetical protein
MKKNITMFLILLLTTPIYSGTPCSEEQVLLKEKKLDLDTKTLKGWVRFLKNKSKQAEYGVTLSKQESDDLIKCLIEEIEYRKKLGKLS